MVQIVRLNGCPGVGDVLREFYWPITRRGSAMVNAIAAFCHPACADIQSAHSGLSWHAWLSLRWGCPLVAAPTG